MKNGWKGLIGLGWIQTRECKSLLRQHSCVRNELVNSYHFLIRKTFIGSQRIHSCHYYTTFERSGWSINISGNFATTSFLESPMLLEPQLINNEKIISVYMLRREDLLCGRCLVFQELHVEWASDWANDLKKKVQGNYSILTWQGTPPPGLHRQVEFFLICLISNTMRMKSDTAPSRKVF